MVGIYKITSPTKRVYIGQSNDIKKRISFYKALKCENQPKLYNSLKKYGWDTHKFEILTECEEIDLNRFERYYQELFNCIKPNSGLNCMLTSSDDRCLVFSDETRLKMSISQTGKKHKESTKQKMSMSHIGVKNSESHNRNISKAHKGRKHAGTALRNMTEAKPRGEAHCFFGKKRSHSFKEKISGSNHYLSKPVLNTETGIYYDTMADAAVSIGWMRERLKNQVTGITKKNTTPFILA